MSSWHKQQVARYYLRTAELYSYQGAAAAHLVVEQVGAALLSGADREACYLLRANAYLQQENADKCKRDLAAILRNDPEHSAAKKLHRQVKRFMKAVDDGAELEKTRQWSLAAEKYSIAGDALNPPVYVPALKAGM